ncbi:MAG: M1 family metallopeptidase [Gemmatimonadota bacterium]
MHNSRSGFLAAAARRLAVVFALASPTLALAQALPSSTALYEPRNVKAAYAAGTRSRDGNPGPRYWQNHGRYRITLAVVPADRTVHGAERIVYWNASPDTLQGVMIKLFLDVHRPGAPREVTVSRSFLTPGLQIDSFAVNGAAQPWRENPRFVTWQPVRLPSPLAPGDSVRLAFRWHYRLAPTAGQPPEARLEGAVDSTTDFLAYFYPRVAVYDDYQGWDTMPFTFAQNFYSDFNDYDVTVRAPSGYVVWGTGTLQDPEQLLQPAALSRYRASLTADSTVHVATADQMAAGQVTTGQETNGWHIIARGVPDVAFAVSNHYDWDAASVVVDSTSGRRAVVQAAYDDTAKDFHGMVRIERHAVGWLSHRWPGVPFPYPAMTVFQGGAGMEYPMMANDISLPSPVLARSQAEHEISHTYMPFYLGIDETRYGFMDEGWATTFEYLAGVDDVGRSMENRIFQGMRVNTWVHDTAPLVDLPITTPGDALGGIGTSGVGLDVNEYGKAALGYLAVRDLLGDATFRKCLHAYIARWHGKHPSPWDFFYTFDDVAGQDLDWFWRDWFFSHHYIDLAVDHVSRAGDGYDVTLDNVGGMDAPVDLVLHFADDSARTVHETPAIWRANGRRATVHVATNRTLTSLDLDGGIWVDANPGNDRWTSGPGR